MKGKATARGKGGKNSSLGAEDRVVSEVKGSSFSVNPASTVAPSGLYHSSVKRRASQPGVSQVHSEDEEYYNLGVELEPGKDMTRSPPGKKPRTDEVNDETASKDREPTEDATDSDKLDKEETAGMCASTSMTEVHEPEAPGKNSVTVGVNGSIISDTAPVSPESKLSHLKKDHSITIVSSDEGNAKVKMNVATGLLEIWCVGKTQEIWKLKTLSHSDPKALQSTLELIFDFMEGGIMYKNRNAVTLLFKTRPQDVIGYTLPSLILTSHLCETKLEDAIQFYKSLEAEKKGAVDEFFLGVFLEILRAFISWKRDEMYSRTGMALRKLVTSDLKFSLRDKDNEKEMKERILQTLEMLLYFEIKGEKNAAFQSTLGIDYKARVYKGWLPLFLEKCIRLEKPNTLVEVGKHSRKMRCQTSEILSFKEGNLSCNVRAHPHVLEDFVNLYVGIEDETTPNIMEKAMDVLYDIILCTLPSRSPINFDAYKFISSVMQTLTWDDLFRGESIREILLKERKQDVLQIAIDMGKKDVMEEFGRNFASYFGPEDEHDCFENLSENKVLEFVLLLSVSTFKKYRLLTYFTLWKHGKLYTGGKIRCDEEGKMLETFDIFRGSFQWSDLLAMKEEVCEEGFVFIEDMRKC